MALPLKERPLNYRLDGEIYHAVFEAVGAASLCWNPRPSNQVFDTTEAERIAVELCFKIVNVLERGHSENDKVSDGGPLTHESKQDANPPFAAPLG